MLMLVLVSFCVRFRGSLDSVEWDSRMNSMSDSSIAKATPLEKNGAGSGPQVSVFAVHGADPEVQAYAMAKYSRSALSMKESLSRYGRFPAPADFPHRG